MSAFKTIGVIGKKRDPRVSPTLKAVCARLHELGHTVLLDAGSADLADAFVRCVSRKEMAACDLIVVVGGDGTLLAAARDLAAAQIPLLGINQGRLGFMVDVNPAEMHETLAHILRGDYSTEERLLLSATIRRNGQDSIGPFLAVNDVVIRNQTGIRMLEFETWLDDEFISQHRADGFILSSPTGSTAYALSGGGPVLHPGLQALALVPICPHTLSDRPIVVGADRTVKIVLRGSEGTRAVFTCDGQTTESLNPGDTITVSRASEKLRLLHPRNYNYFDILRSKLHWGRSPAPLQDD